MGRLPFWYTYLERLGLHSCVGCGSLDLVGGDQSSTPSEQVATLATSTARMGWRLEWQ